MSIADKRAEAARKLTAVQRKTARLKREHGVELAGSKYDVRVSRTNLKKYNSKQLDAFIARADSFTDRRSQFVAIATGEPVPMSKARSLHAKERKLNEKRSRIMRNIGGIEAPFTGMTLAEREQMRPSKRTGGEAYARTFEPVQTDLRQVRSMEALERLDAFRDKQLSPTYARERVNSARDQLDSMLDAIGMQFFKARVNALTDEQFFTFWEYGPYAGEISFIYEVEKSYDDGEDKSLTDQQMVEDLSMEINDAISWAESLEPGINLGPATDKRRPTRAQGKTRRKATRRKGRR